MDIKNIKKLIKISYQETLQELNILTTQVDIKIDRGKEKEKIVKHIKDLEKRVRIFDIRNSSLKVHIFTFFKLSIKISRLTLF